MEDLTSPSSSRSRPSVRSVLAPGSFPTPNGGNNVPGLFPSPNGGNNVPSSPLPTPQPFHSFNSLNMVPSVQDSESLFVETLPGNIDHTLIPAVSIDAERLSQMHQALEGISLILPRLTTKGDIDEQTSRLLESFLSIHRSISVSQNQQQQMTLMMGSILLMLQRINERLDKLENTDRVPDAKPGPVPIPAPILVTTEATVKMNRVHPSNNGTT